MQSRIEVRVESLATLARPGGWGVSRLVSRTTGRSSPSSPPHPVLLVAGF